MQFQRLLEGVESKYPPGFDEHTTFAYYDHACKTYVEVKLDQEFLAMCQLGSLCQFLVKHQHLPPPNQQGIEREKGR